MMPTETFRFDPQYTVGVIFPIKIWVEMEYDCDSIAIDDVKYGGWNELSVFLSSKYDFHESIEKKEKIPCELPDCRDAVKWEFTIRYNIYLIEDVGIFGIDADVHTHEPWAEFASFTTKCICCDD